MHLGMKSYLKSNRNHIAKQTLRSLVFKVSKPSTERFVPDLTTTTMIIIIL
jgi:hypothetical protein